jgi:hypothetical protein
MKQHPKHKGVPQHYGRGKPSKGGRVIRTTHTPGMKKAETTSEWGCFKVLAQGGAVVFACAWLALRAVRR